MTVYFDKALSAFTRSKDSVYFYAVEVADEDEARGMIIDNSKPIEEEISIY